MHNLIVYVPLQEIVCNYDIESQRTASQQYNGIVGKMFTVTSILHHTGNADPHDFYIQSQPHSNEYRSSYHFLPVDL